MKKLVLITLYVSSMFANGSFEKNKQYTCLNTHNIQQGEQVKVDPTEASKKPFVFSLKENKLITNNNVVFDFKVKRGFMSSYSNVDYMILLTPNMDLGLVPKKDRGAVQYYFVCKIK